MKRTIKLMPEYGCFPVWLTRGQFGNVDPSTLPISGSLRDALRDWARAFDATLDQNYPPDSGFATAAELDAFNREGWRILARLREELGQDVVTEYVPPGDSVRKPGHDC